MIKPPLGKVELFMGLISVKPSSINQSAFGVIIIIEIKQKAS